jgi:hypothetical protein
VSWHRSAQFASKPFVLPDTIAAHTPLRLEQKQKVPEILDVGKRLEYVDAAARALEQTGWPAL